MRRFVSDWRMFGWRVALYNVAFTRVHRHDAHVRVCQDGETCPGCDGREVLA